MLAPLLDPVKGVVHGTEFSGIARGSPSAEPIRARGERGHWAPYRPGVGSSREGDVDPPAGRSGGESRAVSEEESRRIIDAVGAKEDRVGFGCTGEGCVISCLLTSSPNDVNPVDQVLAQSEEASLSAGTESVG